MARIKDELRDARGQLASLLGLREGTKVERTADEMDQIQAAESRELAARNLDSLARQLRLINEALDRIEEGSYGICVDCDQEISPRRLSAAPWAKRCVRCQEASERAGTDGSRHSIELLREAA
ncbi:MAG: TraR/DksA family transcriptional regulator [Bryobacterales bacterium]|nr:TraR/DksA family transcriptional regulator [Bryobacterales bacterium]